MLCSHLAHFRTLARIAITATTKQTEQLTTARGGYITQGHQNMRQGIWGMRVIHHHQRCIMATVTSHTPCGWLQFI